MGAEDEEKKGPDAASRGIGDWLSSLRDDMERVCPGYGCKIVTQFFLTYFLFCKSLAYGLVIDSWYPVMVNLYQYPSSDLTDLYTVVRAPWAMKPIWAIMSDVLPICGYNKRFYILISASISSGACIILAWGPVSDPLTAAFFFFMFVAGTTMCDSMSQVRYTELMKAAGNASIVSFVWFLINASGFLGAYNLLLPGSKDEDVAPWRYKILIMLAVPCAIPMVIPAALNWLAEAPLPGATGCRPNTEIIRKYPKFFVLSVVTAGISVGGVVLQMSSYGKPYDLFGNGIEARWNNAMYYGSGALIILVLCQVCLPRNIAFPAVYMFMCKALYLNIGLILQYWYTANDSCFVREGAEFPRGPKFSVPYYQTVSSYGGTAAQLTGVIIFDRTIQFWNVRAAFWVTTAVNCLTTIFELMIIERWNQKALGFDPDTNPSTLVDQCFFIFGAQAIDKLLDMLDALPQTVLIGKLCPKGMEAQTFAVLAALSNFGSNVAYVNGAVVAQVMGVEFTKLKDGSYNCTNPEGPLGIRHLGWLKLIATFVLPLTTVPFTWLFLPNMNLNDDFLDETDENETELTANLAATEPGASFSGRAAGGGGGATASFLKSDNDQIWVAASRGSLLSLGGGGGGRGQVL